jgi:sulfate transport system ATP-binding protein
VELREWLRRLHDKTQVTTLLVTHDQEEALELSDHVVLLRDGRIEQAGSPTELYEHPVNGFVASFLGGARVFTGRVQQGRAEFSRSLSTDVDLADGAVVEAFVRPHDIRVRKFEESPESEDSVAASIERLVHVGSYVKLSVLLPDGDRLVVQMPTHELEERQIRLGDRVSLDLRQVRLKPRLDYVI